MARALIVCLLALSSPALADSPKLAAARAAITQIHYDEAQALLAGALQDGGNSPAAMREIYRLSAVAAIVLDHRDVGEQFYRRWLAIDPTASLTADDSPKLHDAFDAARSYITAHGALQVAASAGATGIDVAISADPLAMAAGVTTTTPGPVVALGVDRRAHLDAQPGAVVVVLDALGNHLIEVTPTAAPATPAAPTVYPPPPPPPAETPRPILKRWTTYAVPFVLTFAAAIVCGSFAIAENDDASGAATPSEAADNRKTRDQLIWATAITGGAAVVFGIPMTIFFLDTPNAKLPNIPGLPTGAGVMLRSRF